MCQYEGLKVDLGANRMEGKVKQESNKKGHVFGRPVTNVPEGVSPLLCLTQAFGPHQGDLFSLWKKDLYWSQLYLIHNVLA